MQKLDSMHMFRALLARGTAYPIMARLRLPDIRGTYVATPTKAKGTECHRRPCSAGAFAYIGFEGLSMAGLGFSGVA